MGRSNTSLAEAGCFSDRPRLLVRATMLTAEAAQNVDWRFQIRILPLALPDEPAKL
jgi:hypothetical protein